MLADAARIEHRSTDVVPPILTTFAILCVIGTMAGLALHFAKSAVADQAFNGVLLVSIASLAWVAVAGLVPVLFRRPFRRGLSARWLIYMSIWAVLWGASMFLSETFAVLLATPMFLVLFMVAAATEAKYAKVGREAAVAGESA